MKTKHVVLSGIAGSVLLLSAGAQAVDIQAGQSQYQNTCAACHGPQGQGQAIFPPLTGMEEARLAELLHHYRAGDEVGPNTALMRPQAQRLSDDDIANVSAFIASEFN